jgi:hypothetical protein
MILIKLESLTVFFTKVYIFHFFLVYLISSKDLHGFFDNIPIQFTWDYKNKNDRHCRKNDRGVF